MALQGTNSKSTWKLMLGRWTRPFGAFGPIFRLRSVSSLQGTWIHLLIHNCLRARWKFLLQRYGHGHFCREACVFPTCLGGLGVTQILPKWVLKYHNFVWYMMFLQISHMLVWKPYVIVVPPATRLALWWECLWWPLFLLGHDVPWHFSSKGSE